MDSRDRLFELIQQVYAAPGSQDGWQVFLDDLNTTFNASAANFISHTLKSHRGGITVTARLDPAAQSAVSAIPVNRSERRGAFSRSDAAPLEALVPHVRRALQLHRRLAAAESTSSVLGSVVERVSHAVLFTDACGTVTFMNPAAEKLVAARDGLMVDDGALRTERPADTTRLRRLLSEAAATSAGQDISTGGAFALGHPSGRRPLLILVLPSSQSRLFGPGLEPTTVMILVTDPESAAIPAEGVLRGLLGLTRAEARLTRLVAQGLTLAEAASDLGLRIETVRSRMRDIFQKTNTHRQAELVRLVLNGTPQL